MQWRLGEQTLALMNLQFLKTVQESSVLNALHPILFNGLDFPVGHDFELRFLY